MEIHTKFNIGQSVWYAKHTFIDDYNYEIENSFGEIDMIAVSKNEEIFYFVEGITYMEQELFETEQELLENLKSKSMKYFSIEELCKSDTANKLGIPNIPTKQTIDNLTKLVKNVLDPLREWYGKPININSGYRCERLNKAVNGAKTSQHLNGFAADIDTNNIGENKKLFDYIRKNMNFDQVILEKKGEWVHVSYVNEFANRKQVLWS